MALRRFQFRSENPVCICSDSGSNFAGDERELPEELENINQEQVSDKSSTHGVE